MFNECWIADRQLEALAGLAAGTNDLPGDAIEVGVHQGLSAIPIANAVYPGILHAVDHWDWVKTLVDDGRVDPEDPLSAESLTTVGLGRETVDRDNYGIFLDNALEGTRGNIRVHKTGWRGFAEQWTGPVRFLHIDAVHTAKEVSDTIATFLPFAAPGAIFCGDDWYYPPVQEGVRGHFPEVNTGPAALWWARLDS